MIFCAICYYLIEEEQRHLPGGAATLRAPGGFMKIIMLLVTIFAVTGCTAYSSQRPFPLEVSEPWSVRECRPVGTFPGPYGYRYWGPPPVVGDYKYQSALRAKEAGATHIFWREATRGYYGQIRLMGYAFDCTGVAMPKYYLYPAPY
jgi:hypothetical protein